MSVRSSRLSLLAIGTVAVAVLALLLAGGIGGSIATSDDASAEADLDSLTSDADADLVSAASDADVDLDPDRVDAVDVDPALEDAIDDARDGTASARDDADGSGSDVQVIVRFEPADRAAVQASDDAVAALEEQAAVSQAPLERYAAQREGVDVERGFWIANAALVTIDADDVELKELAAIPGVERLHANFEVEALGGAAADSGGSASLGPGGPASTVSPETAVLSGDEYTYGLEQIRVPEVWDEFGTQGDGASVAVLDTGIDADHDDLDLHTDDEDDPTYPGGWAEFDGDGEAVDSEPHESGDNSHGTHVSGTVAGGDESGTHIGVAPDVELMHGLVLSGGSGTGAQIIAGVEWAIEEDADVISMSLGVGCNEDGDQSAYEAGYIDLILNAEMAGSAVVGAVGNGGEGCSGSPANIYDAISIGASNENEDIASFSGGELIDTDEAWGQSAEDHWPGEYVTPDVAAPGVGIESTVEGNEYGSLQGTSMATPHVSGVIALMQSATDHHLEPDELEEALVETAWKPDDWDEGDAEDELEGADTRYGDGIINAYAATDSLKTSVSGTVNDTVTDHAVPDATISLEATGSDVSYETTSEGDGSFELDGVDADREYELTVAADGYESHTELITPDADPVDVPIELAGDAELTVTVTDDHFDTPVDGASVAVTPTDGSGSYQGSATDSDGESLVEDLPSGVEYDVTVSADGYEENETEVTVDESGTHTHDIALEGNATLSTTVVSDVTGEAIEGATVVVERDEHSFEIPGSTDETGSLATAVPGTDTTYEVTADADGHHPNGTQTDWIGNGDEASVEIALSPSVLIDGAVLDTESDEVVPNATVEVTATDDSGFEETVQAESDGSYAVPVPPETTYDVTASAAGYDPVVESVEVENESVTAHLALTGDATLEVPVHDAHFEDALSDATVTIETPDGAADPRGPYDGVYNETDEAYLFENVSSVGTYELTVAADGYETNDSETVSIDDGQAYAHDGVDLVGDAAIEGTVRDAVAVDDHPIRNASLTVERVDDSATLARPDATNATGAFAQALPGTNESYTVTVDAEAYDASEGVDVTLDLGQTESLNATLVGNATVTGTISEALDGDSLAAGEDGDEDDALANATVVLEPADGDADYENLTDVNGTYALSVPGTGDYSLNVTARAFESTESTVAVTGDVEADRQLDRKPHFFGIEALEAPAAVDEGDTVTIEATVANLGTENWTDTVSHLVDGDEAANETLELATDGEETNETPTETTVTFEHAADEAGEVTHAVETSNETRSAVVTVAEASSGGGGGGTPAPPQPASEPDLRVTDVSLGATELAVGEPAVVDVTVTNEGDASGSTTLELAADGDVVASESVTVDAGATETVTLEHAFDAPGSYELSVDGTVAGTVEVTDPDAAETDEDPASNETATDDGEDESIPGFGVAVALVALAVAVATRLGRRSS